MTLVKVPYVERCFFCLPVTQDLFGCNLFWGVGWGGGEGLQTRDVWR